MMKPFSSSLYSNDRKVPKRPIPIIKIDSDEDDNEEFSSSAVKRGKNEATTEMVEDEASTTAGSLKEDGEIEDSFNDFSATDASNVSNIDAEVQHIKDLIHDILKEHSLAENKTSAEHFDALNDSENANNSKSFNIIKAPNFKFETTSKGNKLLVVFDSNDKTISYRFYVNHDGTFRCGKCISDHNRTVAAKVFKDENGEDYVHMVHQHLCQPVKYVPPSERHEHEIITAPNYELQVKLNGYRKLVVFVATNPNLCYYYKHIRSNFYICNECLKNCKKCVSAKILKDTDGKEYVQANVPHLCEPVPYVVNKWHAIQAPNFFVSQPNQKLVVFNSDHRNYCYRYYFNKVTKRYKCVTCLNHHQKHVTAKVFKDESGNECLQANRKHLCDPFTYKISDSFDIMKSPNFTLINDETNGSDASMLRVYVSNDRSTWYNFIQMGSSYACSECHSEGNHFMAKLFKDENGEDLVLTWKYQKHVCLPIFCG